MTHSRVFGYGSLAHPGTHGFRVVGPGRLEGWERIWRHREDRPFARLSVRRRAGAVLQGLVADVAPEQWPDLDLREAGYDKHRITADLGATEAEACLYVIPDAPTATPRPILLSYLDTVLAGFSGQNLDGGIEAFFATTVGWDAPVLDDRAAPRYPRHVRPTATLLRAVDAALAAQGTTVIPDRP